MQEYENENINSINIPKKIDNLIYNQDSSLSNKIIRLKICFHKNETKVVQSFEFDDVVKDIVQSRNSNFLDGKINLIEYLVQEVCNENLNQKKLCEILEIQLKINENFSLLNEFGLYLPNLKSLDLSGSLIKSVEDIGTNFNNLTCLNISCCGLRELTGKKYDITKGLYALPT